MLLAVPYLLPASMPLWPSFLAPGGAAWPVSRLRLFAPFSPVPGASNPPIASSHTAPTGQVEVPFSTDDAPTSANDASPLDAQDESESSAPRPLDDPSGHALDKFYEALDLVKKGTFGAKARILYYGDSVVAADWITSTLRRRLQKRFGDAGHGFVLPVNVWAGYTHNDVVRYATNGWKVSRIVGPYASDGVYGLGGVSLIADVPGTMTRVSTSPQGPIGTRVSRFVVTYVAHGTGADLRLRLDQDLPTVRSTREEATAVKTVVVEAPDGPHALEIQSAGRGSLRLLGVDLERDVPGVIVDALGVVGCRMRFLDMFDDATWAQELARRAPQLLVFHYGANESEDGFAYPMDQYEQTARAVLLQARAAVPNASCLIVGPLDRVDKRGDIYVTRDVIPALNEVQRRLATELHCSFFDTFQAMGGRGSMGTWVRRGLGGTDFIHPTNAGAEQLGTWLYRALLESYRARRPTAP